MVSNVYLEDEEMEILARWMYADSSAVNKMKVRLMPHDDTENMLFWVRCGPMLKYCEIDVREKESEMPVADMYIHRDRTGRYRCNYTFYNSEGQQLMV